MKIIDATWEQRNLGVETQEITVDVSDSIADFKDAIKSLKASYSVIKLPPNKVDFVFYAEDQGFRLVETQFIMDGNIKKILPKAKEILRRASFFSVETDNSPEMFDSIASKINEGIFHTDRIAVDPYFSKEIANRRYANWLLDLKDDANSNLQIMKKNENIVGFNLNKNDVHLAHGLIGGLLKQYQSEPLGLYWGAAIFANASEDKGITTWEATISSNNFSIIKLWEYFGLPISSISSVFVRHTHR
jgi:hypothetical protein